MKTTKTAGGIAALYLALAYLLAMPYFLLVLKLPSVADALQMTRVLVDNHDLIYAMELVVYVFFGLALVVLALSLQDRLKAGAEATMKVATSIALIWAGLLIASGMIYNVGMGAVIARHGEDPLGAAELWSAIDLVSSGLSGNGEILGGAWMLLVSLAALRTKTLATPLNVLGLAVAAIGILSVLPFLKDLAVLFGLGQIVWLAWLGVALLSGRKEKTALA